ncbi:MAG: helix-turn-helix domain-containing protein [Candidatus Methanoperedens sp.]|nr:helix-turn-helix domain-containing protein [Candidatus Methanoperedens sp.]
MPLEKLFTGSATAKIIDILWENQGTDLTLTDIAKKAGIHYTTLMKALPLLERLGMVKMTRRVGNAKLYRINKDDAMVKRLIKLLNELNARLAERKPVKKEIPAPKKISGFGPRSPRPGLEIRKNLDAAVNSINENNKSSES